MKVGQDKKSDVFLRLILKPWLHFLTILVIILDSGNIWLKLQFLIKTSNVHKKVEINYLALV